MIVDNMKIYIENNPVYIDNNIISAIGLIFAIKPLFFHECPRQSAKIIVRSTLDKP